MLYYVLLKVVKLAAPGILGARRSVLERSSGALQRCEEEEGDDDSGLHTSVTDSAENTNKEEEEELEEMENAEVEIDNEIDNEMMMIKP